MNKLDLRKTVVILLFIIAAFGLSFFSELISFEALKENRSDNRNTRALELVEAKVHRLSTHYKKTGEIDQKWKYKSVVAQLE